ncbi:MAG: cation:proton antiporter [Eubacterium sp.]|nr:cation:proton antiporter [Eubacterium sp.]
MNYTFFLWLAIILLSTKLCGLIIRKIGLPEVVGFLVAGVLLGPSVLHVMEISSASPTGTFLEDTAELGVVFLMFSAGLDTNLDEMKKNMVASIVTAVIGVIVPLIMGAMAYGLYFDQNFGSREDLMKSVFIGVVLTATSVSITVQTLRELGHLNGKVGTTILGAAVIDDILGIVVLTVVTSLKDSGVSTTMVIVKILLYTALVAVLYAACNWVEPLLKKQNRKRRTGLATLAFCMFMAFISERFFGIADITGAYFAGIMLSSSKVRNYVDEKVGVISSMFFSPVFFASIGIKVTLGGMTGTVWIFAIVLTVVALLSKMLGCGVGAKICGFSNRESLQVGLGMISRGEVALIVAEKGRQVGLIAEDMFAPVVLVVIVTTLLTPILLKMVFPKPDQKKIKDK